MPTHRPPSCQAPDPDVLDGSVRCGVTMRPLGERHPSFGPNYQPGGWVFTCPRCGAVRFIEDERAAKYTERYR